MAACPHPSLEMTAELQSGRAEMRCTQCGEVLIEFPYPSRPRRSYRAGPLGRRFSGAAFGQRALPPLVPDDAPPAVPPHLLCPSCERNPITRNGRCEECQWAVG